MNADLAILSARAIEDYQPLPGDDLPERDPKGVAVTPGVVAGEGAVL